MFQLRKRNTHTPPPTEMHCAMSGSPSCLKQYFVKKFRVSIFLLEENLQPGRTTTDPLKVTPCSPITQNLAKFSLGLGGRGQVGKHSSWFSMSLICKFLSYRSNFLITQRSSEFGTAQCKAVPPPSHPCARRPLEFCGTTWVSHTAGLQDCAFSQDFLPYTINEQVYIEIQSLLLKLST